MEMKLLPHQYEMMTDTTSSVIALICGFGAGKTYAIARKALLLSIQNPGTDGIITEPNFPLITQILIPELEAAFEQFDLEYEYKRGDSIFEFWVPGATKKNRLICKSAESYERLIGISASFVIMDEFDTTKMDIAYNAYLKLLGRIRTGQVRQMVIASTPEGFAAMFRIFVKENVPGTPQAKGKRVIHAKTTDNYHLPESYIDTMRNQYPPELIDSYLNGQFVNLTSGTVYSYFKRDQCIDPIAIKPGETILVGQDFNVGGCASVLFVQRNGSLIAFDTIESKDTFHIVSTIRNKYDNNLTFFPDAAGNQHKSNASQTDIEILKESNVQIRSNKSNPRVQDRINSVNAALQKGKLLVTRDNTTLIEALEQQAYDKNGQPEKYQGPGTIDDFNDAMGYCVHFLFPLKRNRTTIQGR